MAEANRIRINGITYDLGGGGNIKVGYAYKRGSASIASNAYEEVSLSVTLPEGAIPISVVPGQTGSYAEVWARGQFTYENNVLTQAVYVHNRSTGSTATCYPTIQVWYLLGASQYDGGSLTNEEEEEL